MFCIHAQFKTFGLASREEVFGPVAPLLKFKTEEEAIDMANDTNAGLSTWNFYKLGSLIGQFSEEVSLKM